MLLSRGLLLVPVLLSIACSTKPASTPQTPDTPPTQTGATTASPVIDPNDPEYIALDRLMKEPWGQHRDFWNTLQVELADGKKWQRTRILGNPTRASFRYGKENHAVATVWYTPIEGANEPEACLAKFLDYATPIAETNGIVVNGRERLRMTQSVGAEVRPIVVELLSGSLDSLIGHNDYVGAVAAYQSFPGTCLVQGFAVVATNHPELAKKVRDRWVAEGAAKLVWNKRVKEAPPTDAR